MRFQPSLLLASLAHIACADVLFTSPAAGSSFPLGSLDILWTESNTAPLISTLSAYKIDLMAGGADAATQFVVTTLVANGVYSVTGNEAKGATTGMTGQSLTNAFFLRMVSTATGGGTIMNFSDRFTITGLPSTQVWSAAQVQAIQALTSNKGPATINNIANNANAPAGAAGVATPGMAYSLQQGLTRYAPMQKVPPTKITAVSPTPLYPTSAFSLATTYLPIPIAQTTITEAQTFKVASSQNTAAAASQPTAANAAVKRAVERWTDEKM